MVSVTAFFAGILGFMYMALSFYVIRRRWALRLTLGDGGDREASYRIRAHGNFIEYVPFCLLLMGFIELNGGSKTLLGILGAMLVLARLSHAVSLLFHEIRQTERVHFRMAGMIGTFSVLGIASLAALLT